VAGAPQVTQPLLSHGGGHEKRPRQPDVGLAERAHHGEHHGQPARVVGDPRAPEEVSVAGHGDRHVLAEHRVQVGGEDERGEPRGGCGAAERAVSAAHSATATHSVTAAQSATAGGTVTARDVGEDVAHLVGADVPGAGRLEQFGHPAGARMFCERRRRDGGDLHLPGQGALVLGPADRGGAGHGGMAEQGCEGGVHVAEGSAPSGGASSA
jgi:hypothetical protein